MRKRFWCGRMEFESGEGATVSASVNVIVCPGLDNQDAVLAFLHPVAGGATATPIAEAEPTENTNLSAREVQVLMLASEGFTEEQIALILDVKVDVVVVHMQTAKAALGSTSSTEACIRAIKAGLIT